MKRSKRYKVIAAKIDATKVYTLSEALELFKTDMNKFDSGVEMHVRLGIDPSKSEQAVRGTVLLPNGSGKIKRVIAFVSPEKEAEAKEAGADIIGTDEVIAEIKQTGKCNFDVAVATPDRMRALGQVAKILGQQGLMPSPKTETVGPDVKKMVSELKGGKIAFRSDDGGNVHMLVGRISFSNEKLIENVKAVMDAVKRLKPAEVKGTYIVRTYLSTSMGPSIKVSYD